MAQLPLARGSLRDIGPETVLASDALALRAASLAVSEAITVSFLALIFLACAIGALEVFLLICLLLVALEDD